MTIEAKLEQLYAALLEMQIADGLSKIKSVIGGSGDKFIAGIDFRGGVSHATAANRVSMLINNIACLKDHLKSWCRKNNSAFNGEALINGNKDVAIVHDLWNLDKHSELNSPSRSGLSPRFLEPPGTGLVIKATGGQEASVTISFASGIVHSRGDVGLRFSAVVVDKNGNQLGEVEDIALRAVAAWEAEFRRAGLNFELPIERKREYQRLSAVLQQFGLRHRSELPIGATSLLMKVDAGSVSVEIFDRTGKNIGELPNAATSASLRDELQKLFQFAISPDEDGIIAILG